MPTRDISITAEQVAANAVMAGCRPEYMPVVLAAVKAHLHPLGNAHCVTATLTGASQMVIVNGPVRQQLGIMCGAGAFGSWFACKRDYRSRRPARSEERRSERSRRSRSSSLLKPFSVFVLPR